MGLCGHRHLVECHLSGGLVSEATFARTFVSETGKRIKAPEIYTPVDSLIFSSTCLSSNIVIFAA